MRSLIPQASRRIHFHPSQPARVISVAASSFPGIPTLSALERLGLLKKLEESSIFPKNPKNPNNCPSGRIQRPVVAFCNAQSKLRHGAQ
jgi:hypothetical protein